MLHPRRCIVSLTGVLGAVFFISSLLSFLSAHQIRSAPTHTTSTQLFEDTTREAGFLHRHRKPILDHKLDNIMAWVSSVGAAAAAGDYNKDGFLDLYVTNSRKDHPNYLYHNNGDGTFEDRAAQAGVAELNNDSGASMDCAWGDYNNDGWPDLYVVKWGRDQMFRNNGDGTFTEITDQVFRRRDGSPGTEWANGNAVIFFDYNLDGRLDLYIGNYFSEVDLWNLESTRIMHDDFETARNGGRNFLYRQETDGTFTEVAEQLGLDDPGWTLAVGSGDLNNDGWPDLYCADDFGPDQLFLNRKDGTFDNITKESIGWDTKKGMNVDMGDFNQDGWLDIYVANITTAEYLQEGNMLWHNNGPNPDGIPTFTDVSLETGTYDGGWGWGAKFLDWDHDSDLDIIAVNGFISAGEGSYWYALASWTVTDDDSADASKWPPINDLSFSGYEATRLWRNESYFVFSERAAELGVTSKGDGRGVVCFDCDNDGDLDIYIANQDQPPNFYRNTLTSTSSNHWLMVELEGNPETGTNRDGIGTRVTVVTRLDRLIREKDGGNGYSGQSDPRLHFGLGPAEEVQLLEVRWPDGGLQYLENVPANQVVQVRQNPAQYTLQLASTLNPLPRPWVKEEKPKKIVPEIHPDELDRMLNKMESQLEKSLDDYTLASLYRTRCVDYGQHGRSIRFFESLVEKDPDNLRARIELACAYVDKIPTHEGMAAIVSKGTLARKSLDQLNPVVQAKPDLWIAYYTRGMNHLYWPRALRHSDDAAEDFQKCIALQEKQELKPYHLRPYIALGDAYAKNGEYNKAREAWKKGLLHFPTAQALLDRLKIEDNDALSDFIDSKRSLDSPIDTDLSFMDK